MARTTVYHKRGGDELVVESGGKITVESGGEIAVDAGATVTGLTGQTTFASSAEAQAGVVTDKVIAPDTLAAVTATVIRAGLVELATDAETKTGSDTARAITPANLLAAMGAYPNKVILGTLSSANDTSGIAVSASVSKAFAVHADSGGSALTAGSIRASLSRMLIGTAISSGADISTFGIEGLLKSIVSVNVGGNQGGVLGHYESAGTLTLTGSINTVKAGVASFLDLATGGTVAAGTVVSAFGVNPANFGTLTGRASIIHVTNPMSGTWSSFLDLSTATGCTQDAAAGAVADKFLKVYLNGVLYTIAMATA